MAEFLDAISPKAIYITEGNLVSGGSTQSTLLTTIVSINPIHCYFDANEQAFLKYARLAREGKRESSRDAKNPVYMRLIDENGFPHVGHMDFVDNQIDPNTGTIRGRAIFPNDQEMLTPGLFAEVRLPGSGRYDAVLIPDRSVSSDQSEKFVYVVDAANQIERRTVELGPIAKGLRIVRRGLDGSETLVIGGLQRISPGAAVEPKMESIQLDTSGDLPDRYEPVSPEQWLSKPPKKAPEGVSAVDTSLWKPQHRSTDLGHALTARTPVLPIAPTGTQDTLQPTKNRGGL